jgi:hypothetical protein
MLVMLLWLQHMHIKDKGEIVDCAMQSYEDANDSIRLGFSDPSEHRYRFESAFEECAKDFLPSDRPDDDYE